MGESIVHQVITPRQGIDTALGKSRDDLQDVIALVCKAESELPLQFTSFRD